MAIKKKARVYDYMTGKKIAKLDLNAWPVVAGKTGTRADEVGANFMLDTGESHIEFALTRTELQKLLDEVHERFGCDYCAEDDDEGCNCDGCCGLELSCPDDCCSFDAPCECGDCEEC